MGKDTEGVNLEEIQKRETNTSSEIENKIIEKLKTVNKSERPIALFRNAQNRGMYQLIPYLSMVYQLSSENNYIRLFLVEENFQNKSDFDTFKSEMITYSAEKETKYFIVNGELNDNCTINIPQNFPEIMIANVSIIVISLVVILLLILSYLIFSKKKGKKKFVKKNERKVKQKQI